MTRRTPRPTHLDEIAVLLAQGYVRLRQKRVRLNTSGRHSSDDRDISLDSIRQAERSLAGHESFPQEDANGCLTRS